MCTAPPSTVLLALNQQWSENIKWKIPERRRKHVHITVTEVYCYIFYLITNFPHLLLCLALKLIFIVSMYRLFTLQSQAGEGLRIYPTQVKV